MYARAVRLTFLTIAGAAIWRQAGSIDWSELGPLLHGYRWPQLGLAIGFTAGSFLLLGVIEILALRSIGGTIWIPRRDALGTAFIAHAVSQSAGVSLLTGTALRMRAYAGRLSPIAVARITAYVTVAILLGLLSLGSGILLSGVVPRIGAFYLPARPLGVVLALIVLSWLSWSVLARNLSPAIIAAQIGVSALDWCLTATTLFVLLPSSSPFAYLTFISAAVLSHTLGMLSLVPGGAGVFEATMFTLLAADSGDAGRETLAAALIAFRLIYYILPLGAAMAVILATLARRVRTTADTSPVRSVDTLSEARPESSPTVDWLIDNAIAYDTVVCAMGSARRSIWMTQLAFDADCRAFGPAGRASVVADALLAAAERSPIDIRIVLNETFLLDTARPLRRFFTERLAARPCPGTIEVRGVSSFPRLLHAKMVIVDGDEAFLLGSPFVNGYWDDETHQPVDARRPLRELGGRPLHDLSVRVTGAPVAELERLFTGFWTPNAPVAPQPAVRADGIRVASTSPRGVLRNRPSGATEILEALLEGIAAARSLIYIEHQYLSSRPIAAALAAALMRAPALEIIAVLNENADVTAYRRWQNARLEESGLTGHPRVGLFALWTAARGTGRTTLNQIFVHSKLVAVDDVWATAGSANLDGASLNSYGDDFSGIGRRVFRHTRNFDVNVIVEGSSAGHLRSRLWAEHLGAASDTLVDRPDLGWLPLWRARAAANVAALSAVESHGDGPVMRGFVLPYSVAATPARQLADIGVHVDPRCLDVSFDPGWLEVHFSPNWVRNMFS